MSAQCICRSDDDYDRIVWLEYPAKRIDPYRDFLSLAEAERRTFRKAFEYWSKGLPQKKRHHGWSEPDRKECYVFKDNPHRLYGFLSKPIYGDQHALCVICIYDKKKADNTDPTVFWKTEPVPAWMVM